MRADDEEPQYRWRCSECQHVHYNLTPPHMHPDKLVREVAQWVEVQEPELSPLDALADAMRRGTNDYDDVTYEPGWSDLGLPRKNWWRNVARAALRHLVQQIVDAAGSDEIGPTDPTIAQALGMDIDELRELMRGGQG